MQAIMVPIKALNKEKIMKNIIAEDWKKMGLVKFEKTQLDSI